MFYCSECANYFCKPLKNDDRHGFSSGPVETLYCCPKCKSLAISEKKEVI